MKLHDVEEAMGMRKILAHYIRMKKRTLSGFLQIFMELCKSKVQLAPLHGNFINSMALLPQNHLYAATFFQILCIDCLFYLKMITLTENSLNFNVTYTGWKQPFESFF